MTLAIAVSLKKIIHRPFCCKAEKITGAIRDHLSEAEMALAIPVFLKRIIHRSSCSVAQRATEAMMKHLLKAEVTLAIAVLLQRRILLFCSLKSNKRVVLRPSIKA